MLVGNTAHRSIMAILCGEKKCFMPVGIIVWLLKKNKNNWNFLIQSSYFNLNLSPGSHCQIRLQCNAFLSPVSIMRKVFKENIDLKPSQISWQCFQRGTKKSYSEMGKLIELFILTFSMKENNYNQCLKERHICTEMIRNASNLFAKIIFYTRYNW